MDMNLSLNKMPWYGQIGAFVALALGITAAFWYFYVQPAQEGLAAKRTELAKLQTTISSGLVRRHSSVGSKAITSTTDSTGACRSVRSIASSSAMIANAPTSPQSDHRVGGGLAGRGSSQTDRTRSCTHPSYEPGRPSRSAQSTRRTSPFGRTVSRTPDPSHMPSEPDGLGSP